MAVLYQLSYVGAEGNRIVAASCLSGASFRWPVTAAELSSPLVMLAQMSARCCCEANRMSFFSLAYAALGLWDDERGAGDVGGYAARVAGE